MMESERTRISGRLPAANRPVTALALVAALSLAATSAEFDKSKLPEPVFEAHPEYVELYWKAWELAFEHITVDEEAVQSPFMDEGREEGKISLWESAFIAMFTKYAPDMYPGIESLNEYYAQIHDNATSSQTIEHEDNPPILAWAEWEHFKVTGDTARVKWLLEENEYLQKHFQWFHDTRLARWDEWEKGYHWSRAASGMTNTPRGRYYPGWKEACDEDPSDGHWGYCEEVEINYQAGNEFQWIDAISQQCLSAKCIASLARAIGDEALAEEWDSTYQEFATAIDERYWRDDQKRFFDFKNRIGGASPQLPRTPATFWTLLCRAATEEHAEVMVEGLVRDPRLFGGAAPFPSLIVADFDADLNGRGWRGGVFPSIVYMGVKALKEYGYDADADRVAHNMVRHMAQTYANFEPQTIWEAYSPTEWKPSTDTGGTDLVNPDYCGWSAVGPISLFIEHVLGFHTIDARAGRVQWRLHWPSKHGVKRLKFGGIEADIMYESGTVTVNSTGDFTLVINGEEHAVTADTPAEITVTPPEQPPVPPLPVRPPLGQGVRIEGEGDIEYPYHLRLPHRRICSCSQGYKFWMYFSIDPRELPPLPEGNTMVMRLAGQPNNMSINGTYYKKINQTGSADWVFVTLHDVPLDQESNTVEFDLKDVGYFSLDYVEVATLDPASVSENPKSIERPVFDLRRAGGRELSVTVPVSSVVELVDMRGRTLRRWTGGNQTRTMRLTLPSSALPNSGLYIVRMRGREHGTLSKPVMLMK